MGHFRKLNAQMKQRQTKVVHSMRITTDWRSETQRHITVFFRFLFIIECFVESGSFKVLFSELFGANDW